MGRATPECWRGKFLQKHAYARSPLLKTTALKGKSTFGEPSLDSGVEAHNLCGVVVGAGVLHFLLHLDFQRSLELHGTPCHATVLQEANRCVSQDKSMCFPDISQKIPRQIDAFHRNYPENPKTNRCVSQANRWVFRSIPPQICQLGLDLCPEASSFGAKGEGFWVLSFGFWGLGVKVKGLGLRVEGLEFRS